ncbi:MAG: 50S ribosomal protein L31e [Candidatus Heimdallarchaeota archaeon]|nr:50S ribosomal protein L31e [Candidatus Heimdallarchaeota archaeon]MBY8994005.1 50S ribosomal protein L31e [Candidatus Heimdallarchaeota archaeon]
MSEDELVEERIYTIPFYPKLKLSTRQKRAPRAIRIMKEFIYRHMKAEDIIIDNELNEFIWARGIQKPPRKVRVRAIKDDEGIVELYLVERKVAEEARIPEVRRRPGRGELRPPKEDDVEEEEDE